MKKILFGDSYNYAIEFYNIRDNQYIPAIQNGDINTGELLQNTKLKDSYEKHRSSIDKVVDLETQLYFT